MKCVMIVMLGALLAGLAACQSDMTGPRPMAANSALENCPDNMHRDVARGDVYFEEIIDRYDLSKE